MHFVHCASDSPPLALRRFRLYSFGAGHRRLFGLRRVTMIVIIIIRHHKRHCHRHHRGHCHRAIRGPGLPPSSSLRSWTRQPRHSRGAGARRGPRDRGTHPTRTQREDKMLPSPISPSLRLSLTAPRSARPHDCEQGRPWVSHVPRKKRF